MSILPIAFALMAVTGFGGAMLCGALAHRQAQRQQQARDHWQALRLRNGITAPSPWHPPTSPINAAALVEVHPKRKKVRLEPWEFHPFPQPGSATPAPEFDELPLHEWELESVPIDEPASTASVQPPRPLENTAERDFSREISPGDKTQLRKLVKSGETRKTQLAQQVYGVKSGKRYQEVLPTINAVLQEFQSC
ncbi:MAG: hypothetical protein AAF766_22940 [Cyanobacteria bacterium P01_D01_bin.14]